MKNIRTKLLLLLICIALAVSTTACSRPAASLEPVPIEGFSYYENPTYSLKVQYPSQWSAADGTITADQIDLIKDKFGQNAVELLQSADFSTITAIWYDFEKSANNFTPNANLNVTEQAGLTQNALKASNNQKQLQQAYEQSFSTIFDGFEPLGDIIGDTFGQNYFLIYKYNITLGDVDVCAYQAMTANDSKAIVFSFITSESLFDSSIEQYETILSTLEFSK